MSKMQALIHFLECSSAEVQLNGSEFEVGTRSYLVLTDREATAKTREHILETLWAFRPEFLQNYTAKGVDADILRRLQERYEDSNEAILKLVTQKNALISDAIGADGRGHFLSSYDGEEHEVTHNKTIYYIYRTN